MSRTFRSFREPAGSCNGFEFFRTISGGKAGVGRNKTASLQVWKDDFIVKRYRYATGNPAALEKAKEKARQFARRKATQ
jgi:hypothetical protein